MKPAILYLLLGICLEHCLLAESFQRDQFQLKCGTTRSDVEKILQNFRQIPGQRKENEVVNPVLGKRLISFMAIHNAKPTHTVYLVFSDAGVLTSIWSSEPIFEMPATQYDLACGDEGDKGKMIQEIFDNIARPNEGPGNNPELK